MMDGGTVSVMRRLVRPAPDSARPQREPQLTPSRALRMSLIRAAATGVGLPIGVLGVTEEVLTLDDLMDEIADGMLLLSILPAALQDEPVVSGVAALDAQAVAAVIEMQMTGRLRPAAPDMRPVTGTDAALAAPWIELFLTDLLETTPGTQLEGWTEGYRVGPRLTGRREAAIQLEDGAFRMVRMTVDLGAGDRQGQVMLALPASRDPAPPVAPVLPDWSADLRDAVMPAPTTLHAILHRMTLPIATVEGFAVGQVLDLTGVTVSSVRIEQPGGGLVARARLGRLSGMRAARIETELPPLMQDVPALPMGGAPSQPWDAATALPLDGAGPAGLGATDPMEPASWGGDMPADLPFAMGQMAGDGPEGPDFAFPPDLAAPAPDWSDT